MLLLAGHVAVLYVVVYLIGAIYRNVAARIILWLTLVSCLRFYILSLFGNRDDQAFVFLCITI